MMGGNWVEARIMAPEFMEKAGITQDQAEKLKAALKELDDAAQKINEEIMALSRQQADLMLKVLSEAGANADELTQLTEKIGGLRTEQAKLVNKRLFLIRDNLSAEQRKKVGDLLQEERTNRMNQMQQRQQQRQQGGGQGGGAAGGGGGNANNAPRPAAPQGW
jgi:chromosome segregation ATPase